MSTADFGWVIAAIGIVTLLVALFIPRRSGGAR